jgi:hypothetical protein
MAMAMAFSAFWMGRDSGLHNCISFSLSSFLLHGRKEGEIQTDWKELILLSVYTRRSLFSLIDALLLF